jgi:hypothetical protein
MSQKLPAFHIVIPIYESVNLFDVTSACEMFYWMGYYLKERKEREVTLELVEATGRVVKTGLSPTTSLPTTATRTAESKNRLSLSGCPALPTTRR